MRNLISVFTLIFCLPVLVKAQADPETQPRTLQAALKTTVALRMGDTVTLKGTDFSATLVGFHEPLCPGPAASCGKLDAIPEFRLTEGTTICEPKMKSRACQKKLTYVVHADRVTDRAAVKVRIKKNRKGKH